MKNIRNLLKYTIPIKKHFSLYNLAFRFKYIKYSIKQFTDKIENKDDKNSNLVINCK